MMKKEQIKGKFVLISRRTLIEVVIAIIFLGIIFYQGIKIFDITSHFNNKYSNEFLELNSLLPKTFEEKVMTGERFVAYISRPACPACQHVTDGLSKLIKEFDLSKTMYYVNVTSIRKNSSDAQWVNFKDRYGGIPGTPAFLLIDDCKVVSYLSWTDDQSVTNEMIKDWLLNNEII